MTSKQAKSHQSAAWLGWLFAAVTFGVALLVVIAYHDMLLLAGGLALAEVILLAGFFLETQLRHRVLRLAAATSKDLTKERDQAIEQRSKDEAILSSIADGVLGLDADGKVILFNRAASDIAELKAEAVVGKQYDSVLHFVDEKSGDANADFIMHALRGKASTAVNAALAINASKQVPISSAAAPIINADGKQLGAIVTFRNVTHERQLEHAKDEFVSLVSHQLRSPLTASRLFVEMLLDNQVGKLNPKQRDYLTKVELSTWRMIDLVNDFLNTSRIELDRLKIEPQEIHLEELVTSIVENLRPLAEQKGLVLMFDKKQLPSVFVEPNLYSQIVNNLLTNAIRYTPSGGRVAVTLERTAKGYKLDVADTGIGIPKAAQPDIFKRFYRADNARRLESEGSGLGLYLVKRIADISGGRVWFETSQGHGTVFHVIIPHRGMAAKSDERTA